MYLPFWLVLEPHPRRSWFFFSLFSKSWQDVHHLHLGSATNIPSPNTIPNPSSQKHPLHPYTMTFSTFHTMHLKLRNHLFFTLSLFTPGQSSVTSIHTSPLSLLHPNRHSLHPIKKLQHLHHPPSQRPPLLLPN